jgi:NADH:ubiquinone reductase (H+-translocating)
MAQASGLRRVVIVGGGFAGLFAARELRDAPVQVTLLDRAEHHLFQPLLYQYATGILSEGKIATPLRELLERHRNVEFALAEVTGIDAAGRHVQARRPLGEQLEFDYDYLILAAGVRQSYFGHDEYAEFAPGMKSIEDAQRIRRRVFGAFEMAESATDPAERSRWLTFVLVGAGPTGVELAGQVRELATRTLSREFRHIEPREARVLLFDGGKAPLASFGRGFPRWPLATSRISASSCTWARSSQKPTCRASRSRTAPGTSPDTRPGPSCGPRASRRRRWPGP